MACASLRAGVPIATGDTKVVESGKADGLTSTSRASAASSIASPSAPGRSAGRPGDLFRPDRRPWRCRRDGRPPRLELEPEVRSDTAPLHTLVSKLLRATDGVRCLRDPTRGGVATVLSDLAAAEVGVTIDQSLIPVRPEVTRSCETLASTPCTPPTRAADRHRLPDAAHTALAALRPTPRPRGRCHRQVTPHPRAVTLLTAGASRAIETLAGAPMPRICCSGFS